MIQTLSLNGCWELYCFEEIPIFTNIHEIDSLCKHQITAVVPGNFELDLARAGIIDSNLFQGMATQKNQIFEDWDWWYKKEFDIPEIQQGQKLYLKFGGVDCLAEYYLNGKKIYHSDNAFTEQRFQITEHAKTGKNILYVHICSATKYVFQQEYNQYLCSCAGESLHSLIRKPAHSFGWDIFPRAVTGGIWRDVDLEIADSYNISEISYFISDLSREMATITFLAVIDIPYEDFKRQPAIRVQGKCGSNQFSHTHFLRHNRSCRFWVDVEKPCLWWPYGYGEANIYDISYELLIDGQVRDTGCMNLGIRTVQLLRTDTMFEEGHCFKFVVNGVDIMCKGSNWVPLSPYHSMDMDRYAQAMPLFTDTHCNILRVWGGGIYEADCFYDYCDRHGIMVWQDFCMACHVLPPEGTIYENLEKEAVWVVKKLRHHPSIVLWSGDNEIDECMKINHKNPAMNKITRELLPKVVFLHDTLRPYLASSPYITEVTDANQPVSNITTDIYPERHLWGSRDYYKADFYTQSRAHFVSETGYHGCPSPDSVAKIVDNNCIWPVWNEQWTLHSSDQIGSNHRVKLMEDQIAQLFAFRPTNLEDFSLASQISQAEAKKFFIERIRIKKPYTSGIIWWNMLDGWPQMSDAVVDYFFKKKLAYHYIKRSQAPVCLMIDEMQDWNYTLVASNDTLQATSGHYRVYDVMTGKVYTENDFFADSNSNRTLTKIPLLYSDKVFLVIEWTVNDKKFFNHYLCGYPPFDFQTYKRWLEAYSKITELTKTQ